MSAFQRENRGGTVLTVDQEEFTGELFIALGRKDAPMRPAFEIAEKDRFILAMVVAGKEYVVVRAHENHQWQADGECAIPGCAAVNAGYPFQDGNYTTLGPEIFSSTDAPADDTVINWRGENFTVQPPPRELLIDPANEANIGDVVEIEAKDGSWSVRGTVGDVDNSSHRPLYFAFLDEWPLVHDAYVYRTVGNLEFQALKTVFTVAQDAVEDDDGGYLIDDLIREMARRKVRVVDE